MKKLLVITSLGLAAACLYAILTTYSKSHSTNPDISDIVVHVEVQRLERTLFALCTKEEISHFLQENQPFAQQFLGIVTPSDERELVDKLYAMVHDAAMHDLYKEVQRVFGDFSGIQHQLEEAFRYLRYYYPNFEVPQVATFMTGMGSDLYVSDDLIVIGLDFFLGEGAQFRPIKLPEYILRTYQPAYVVPKIVLLLSQRFNKATDADYTLLGDMLYYGKSCYFTKAMLPYAADSIIIGYTAEQLADTRKHQDIVWEHFIEYELLYETNHLVKEKYIGNRPFTAEIGPKCPGNIGGWLGWEIVKQYMKANSMVSLPALMSNPDAQQLFTQSKYRPRK